MLKIFKKEKEEKKENKTYDFKYTIYFDDCRKIEGTVTNSSLPPEKIFLNNSFTYLKDGICTYFNNDKISALKITNLVEKIEVENEKDN